MESDENRGWRKKQIPLVCLFPKSRTISQFRNVDLLNVERKFFFSVLARRMTNFLIANGYIDTSCHKSSMPKGRREICM